MAERPPRFQVNSGGVAPIRVEVDADGRLWISGAAYDDGEHCRWGWRLKPDESQAIAHAILEGVDHG